MKTNSLFVTFSAILIIVLAIVFSLPTFLNITETNNWYLNKKVNLGFDLQGGSHILLEVKNESLLKEEIDNIVDFFRQFIRKERLKVESLTSDQEKIRIKLILCSIEYIAD